ncbi:PepSY-like domain-containing protein [Chitinophaga cymbidii]|uniref:Uncharacterized protein n=1 Tax=Chitinophaga cymbidii TaxID=1096750 RepID=A0A512RPX8_9BACT|nr:PepSY-like domain-containing protein [Chitinophaga cymbidii]GEP97734.1 hypothetical protein CCY01nite_39940 [Chitinophaga cymbidii]
MNTKNYLVAAVLLAATIMAGCSQKGNPPEKIVAAFKKLHPQATIEKWNDEPPVWEAKYKDATGSGAVSFDKNGVVTETELVINEDQLPAQPAIPDYIQANYKEKLQRCEKIVTADGTTTYEIQITGKEIVFDAQGKFLQEEAD